LIGRAQMRVDESILEATARLLQNNTEFVNNNLGKIQNIFDKLAATGARCRTCKSPGNNFGIKYIYEIVDDLSFAIKNYGNNPSNNFGKLLTEMASSGNKADGGAFILQYLKNKGETFASQVDQFENFYLDGANFEADIKMLGEGSLKEFKSFAKDSWKGFGSNGSSGLKQLQGYIKSGKPFEYLANKTKLINDGVTDPLTFVKQQFQRVFKNNSGELFNTNPSLFKDFNIPDETVLKTLAEQGKLSNHPLLNNIIKIE